MTTPISPLLLNFAGIWSALLLFYLTFTIALPITWFEIWLLRKLYTKKASGKEVQQDV